MNTIRNPYIAENFLIRQGWNFLSGCRESEGLFPCNIVFEETNRTGRCGLSWLRKGDNLRRL